MKPKNLKERKKSFLKFLLLFIFTVLAIVLAVFFTFKVPIEENKLLKSQSISFDEELKFQKKFSTKITETKKLLDSLDVPGTNTKYINELVSKNLAELQKTIPEKSDYDHDMYYQIVNMMVGTQNMKGRLWELKDAESTIEEYKEALDEANENFKQLERDLIIARGRR